MVEDKFVIKEISGSLYRFKESRSRLLLRKKASEKVGKRDESEDIAEMSTAPTQRTNLVYVPLEDSFDEAALHDLQYQPTKENSVPHIRSGKLDLIQGKSMSESDDDPKKSIFNSCPEDVKVAEVRLFLEKLGMSKFELVFLKNGFDSMDVLMEITDEMMKQLEIPIGFRIKFNKTRADLQLKTLQRLSSKTLSPLDKTGGSSEKTIPKEKEAPQPTKNTCETGAMQTDTMDLAFSIRNSVSGLVSNTTKYCYRCFSKVREIHESEYCPGNYFCSDKCLKFFFLDQTIVCASESCKTMGVKTRAWFHNGQWFCSEQCSKDFSPPFDPHFAKPDLCISQQESKDETLVAGTPRRGATEVCDKEDQTAKHVSEGFGLAHADPESARDEARFVSPEEVDLDFDF